MNEELYKIMKEVYAKFTGEELAVVLGVIRKEIQAEQMQKELENKILKFTRELTVVKEQQRTLRD